jgi:hypothetical protein
VRFGSPVPPAPPPAELERGREVHDVGAEVGQDVANPGYGVPVPLPPRAMPWGETVAYVQDPEGTMLLVIQDEPHD